MTVLIYSTLAALCVLTSDRCVQRWTHIKQPPTVYQRSTSGLCAWMTLALRILKSLLGFFSIQILAVASSPSHAPVVSTSYITFFSSNQIHETEKPRPLTLTSLV